MRCGFIDILTVPDRNVPIQKSIIWSYVLTISPWRSITAASREVRYLELFKEIR